jgi:enolase
VSRTAIAAVRGRAVWDSRGQPTVEAEVALEGGALGRAIAPAGASTGSGEAVELRDGGDRFGGRGVGRAVAAINGEIAAALAGMEIDDQAALDARLIALDGTPDKARLGGNALIAVSMAAAHVRAAALGVPLWRSLAGDRQPVMPLPEIQLFGGGAHAARRIDIQDVMVIAIGAATYAEALGMTAEVYRAAGLIMAERGRLAGVADEGGYWPEFASNEEALATAVAAIERAGFVPGRDLALSLDIAASELERGGRYRLAAEGRELDSDGMAALLLSWLERYPIVSIEDPLGEDDEVGLVAFTKAAGPQVQVVGDDYLATSAERVRRALAAGACNAALIKPNQAGTLTETKAALDAALAGGWGAIVSARSGETEDVTIVHLAVGWGAGQLKVGSFSRSERMAKWNEGLRIAETLSDARLPPPSAFPWGHAAR